MRKGCGGGGALCGPWDAGCVWRCVCIFVGVFQRRKNARTFGCCLCGTFDVSMWSRWCRAAIVALVKLFTWCACLWNSA